MMSLSCWTATAFYSPTREAQVTISHWLDLIPPDPVCEDWDQTLPVASSFSMAGTSVESPADGTDHPSILGSSTRRHRELNLR